MKKLLLTFVLCFVAFGMNAAEAVFDFSKCGELNSTLEGITSGTTVSDVVFTSNGVTLVATKGSSTDAKIYINSGTYNLRVYTGSTTTITAPSGYVITGIALEYRSSNSGGFTANSGTYTTGSWTGAVSPVVLTCTGNSQITKLTVTYAEEGNVPLSAPVLSLTEGTYYASQSVTISNPNSSGKVYYTTDGTDPTSSSTEYTGAISIAATTTLKAIAIDSDASKQSDIVSATYTIAEPTGITTYAEYEAAVEGAVLKFNATVTAVYQSGNYLYAVFDSKPILIYGSVGQTYENGDVVPAGFYGTKTNYNGVIELSTAAGAGYSKESFQASTSKVDPIEPTVVTVEGVSAEGVATSLQNAYLRFEKVTLDADAKTIKDANGTATFPVYTTLSALPASGEYTITGFMSTYKTTNQFLPVEFKSEITVDDVKSFKALEEGSIAKFNNPVTVVAVYETEKYRTCYVVDASAGMMIYGAIGEDYPEYKAGDVIPAGFSGTVDTYQGNIQMTSPEGLAASTENAPATPTVTLVEEVAQDMAGQYVRIESANVAVTSGKNLTITDATGDIAGYNRFSVTTPTEVATCTVDAIVNLYQTTTDNVTTTVTQLLPVAINVTSDITDITDDESEEVQIIPGPGEGEVTIVGADGEIYIYTLDGKLDELINAGAGRSTTVKGAGDPIGDPVVVKKKKGTVYIIKSGDESQVVLVN